MADGHIYKLGVAMRHNVAGRKLGRKSAHRLAMFRNMASSLIDKGRIKTTLIRAKELKAIADQLVTLGKNDSLHARRQAFDMIRNRDAVQKLFSKVAPSFKERKGGYTRVYRTDFRHGDSAPMAYIEYLNEDLMAFEIAGGGAESGKKAKKKLAAKTAAKSEKVEKAEKKSAPKKKKI